MSPLILNALMIFKALTFFFQTEKPSLNVWAADSPSFDFLFTSKEILLDSESPHPYIQGLKTFLSKT